MKHFGDITKINGAEVPIVDIITGGSPCQDLSVAGKRAGLKHSDKGDEETTRSGLFMEQIRIFKEMRNAKRIRWYKQTILDMAFVTDDPSDDSEIVVAEFNSEHIAGYTVKEL